MLVAVSGRLLLLADDSQKVGLEGDVEIVLSKARHRNGTPVAVIAGLDDVIGRPVADRAGTLAFSRRLKTRSKPTLERNSGA